MPPEWLAEAVLQVVEHVGAASEETSMAISSIKQTRWVRVSILFVVLIHLTLYYHYWASYFFVRQVGRTRVHHELNVPYNGLLPPDEQPEYSDVDGGWKVIYDTPHAVACFKNGEVTIKVMPQE
jgi:hypothetical protein